MNYHSYDFTLFSEYMDTINNDIIHQSDIQDEQIYEFLQKIQKNENAIQCFSSYQQVMNEVELVYGNDKMQKFKRLFEKFLQEESNYFYEKGDIFKQKIGKLYFQKKSFIQAIIYYDQAILFNYNKEIYLDKGIAQFELGLINDSIDSFDKLIQLNSQYGDAYYHKGKSLAFQRNFYKAIDQFDLALQIDQTNSLIYFEKAKALIEVDSSKVLECLNESLRYNQSINTLNFKAQFLYDQKNFQESQDVFKQIIKIDQENINAKNMIKKLEFLLNINNRQNNQCYIQFKINQKSKLNEFLKNFDENKKIDFTKAKQITQKMIETLS